ncbi:MAG: trigger factor [Coriobacteriia bacterium]
MAAFLSGGLQIFIHHARARGPGAELADSAAREAFLQTDMHLADSPEIQADGPLIPNAPYTIHLNLKVIPELELSEFSDICIAVPMPSVIDDASVDARIDLLRMQFTRIVPVLGRGVASTDVVLLSSIGFIDGQPFDGDEAKERLLELGCGSMPPELEAGIVGMVPGESRRIEFEIPASHGQPEVIGKKAVFEVTVVEISEKDALQTDDELAEAIGLSNALALRNAIRESLAAENARERSLAIEKGARAELARRLHGEVPPPLVETHCGVLWRAFLQQLAEAGTTLGRYCDVLGTTEDEVREQTRARAEQEIREGLALEALFRAQGFVLEKEDLDATIADLAAANYTSPTKIREELLHQSLPVLKEKAIHRKATQWLLDNVTAVESEKYTPCRGV